jgi:hypothetical protein
MSYADITVDVVNDKAKFLSISYDEMIRGLQSGGVPAPDGQRASPDLYPSLPASFSIFQRTYPAMRRRSRKRSRCRSNTSFILLPWIWFGERQIAQIPWLVADHRLGGEHAAGAGDGEQDDG